MRRFCGSSRRRRFLSLCPLRSLKAAIAEQVTDASGAVLPGVTVEAASPALIERARRR